MSRRRVLVIDDERLLAEALCDVLSDDHDVELATTVAAAVRRLREDPGFEVVLCDVMLPDGTAVDIHRAYRAAFPGREHRMVFITGGTDDPQLRAIVAAGRHEVLRKPFDLDKLAALIERVAAAG